MYNIWYSRWLTEKYKLHDYLVQLKKKMCSWSIRSNKDLRSHILAEPSVGRTKVPDLEYLLEKVDVRSKELRKQNLMIKEKNVCSYNVFFKEKEGILEYLLKS